MAHACAVLETVGKTTEYYCRPLRVARRVREWGCTPSVASCVLSGTCVRACLTHSLCFVFCAKIGLRWPSRLLRKDIGRGHRRCPEICSSEDQVCRGILDRVEACHISMELYCRLVDSLICARAEKCVFFTKQTASPSRDSRACVVFAPKITWLKYVRYHVHVIYSLDRA